MDAATAGDLVFAAVVLARFVTPLFIPRFPLPAIVTALVLDAVDRDIFANFSNLDLARYQGIDKSLDIFYLTIAMLAVLRNWTQPTAAATARFLFYYRLVGVTAFELTEWRPLLLIFPNTFEYFFIFYELLRTRWSPERFSGRFYVVAAAAIWIFIKLPQEYWIHVAQLDFTDEVKERVFGVSADASWSEAVSNRPGVLVVLVLAVVGLVLAGRAWAHAVLGPPEHPLRLRADPLPENIDEARERAWLLSTHWRVLDANLAEKIVLVSLISVIFGQVIPQVQATPLQLTLGVAVVATFNSVLTLRQARKERTMESAAWSFTILAVVNVLFVFVGDLLLRRSEGDLNVATTLFFLLLLTLLVTLYDRFRPVHDVRFLAEAEV